MMRLKVEPAGSGLHPSETVVVVRTTAGTERLVVSRQSVSNNSIEIGWPIRTRDDFFLLNYRAKRKAEHGAYG